MPSKKKAPAKRGAADASLSSAPAGERFKVSKISDLDENTPEQPSMPPQSETSAQDELGSKSKTPVKRNVPCVPCLEAPIIWNDGEGDPPVCFGNGKLLLPGQPGEKDKVCTDAALTRHTGQCLPAMQEGENHLREDPGTRLLCGCFRATERNVLG